MDDLAVMLTDPKRHGQSEKQGRAEPRMRAIEDSNGMMGPSGAASFRRHDNHPVGIALERYKMLPDHGLVPDAE